MKPRVHPARSAENSVGGPGGALTSLTRASVRDPGSGTEGIKSSATIASAPGREAFALVERTTQTQGLAFEVGDRSILSRIAKIMGGRSEAPPPAVDNGQPCHPP